MGVAAVLAGLRSTLKSGTESCQKQKELLSNNTMMLSVSCVMYARDPASYYFRDLSLPPFLPPSPSLPFSLPLSPSLPPSLLPLPPPSSLPPSFSIPQDMQTELQKDTAKSSTLRSQVAHHRSLWEEREKRASENERRRREAERRAREERERETKEARLEKIRREQEQAIRERKEARIQETKVCWLTYICVLHYQSIEARSGPAHCLPDLDLSARSGLLHFLLTGVSVHL